MTESITAALVGIGVLGVLSQWLAWRIRQPAILFLLLAGIGVGPGLGWLDPDALLGDLLFPVVSLAVSVILFEGGLTLRRHEIRGISGPVQRLLTLGVAITWGTTAVFAALFTGLDRDIAVLFGAVTIVTGPTVIVPLLRSVRPNPRIASVLRWEGIVIDPLGAVIAVLVFEFLVSNEGAHGLLATVPAFATVLFVGIGLGVAAGWVLGVLLRNFWLPDYLHNVGTLVAVFAVFYTANRLHAESGLVAVTVMGMWLANMPRVPLEGILDFKESLSLLLISGLFILLAARLDPASLLALGWGSVGLLLAMQLVGRPLTVLACTLGSPLTWPERALIAWVAPRGIVAAAVAALFALRLRQSGHPGAELLVPLTFLVILFTVVLQSVTAKPLARLLDVREPPPRGVLLIGANAVARAIAEALTERELIVRLIDPVWDNINEAHLAGLDAYFGHPTSEHAERNLDLSGIGMMFAVSPRADLNALASLHFARELGQNNVYQLPRGEREPPPPEDGQGRRHENRLFGEDATYAKLASLISRGATVRATELTDRFGPDEYARQHPDALRLLAVDDHGRLRVFAGEDDDPQPQAGWTLLSLIGPPEPEAKAVDAGRESPEAAG